MGDLLFNPQGRILRNRFWQGLVMLTVASVLVTAGSAMVSSAVGFVSLLLVYPYICVYGKRLHDAGTTAWWVIAIWLGSVVLSFIFGLVAGPFFTTAEDVQIQQEMAERMAAGDLTGMMEGAEILSKRMLPLNLIATVGVNVILGLIIGSLPTQQSENKHGPVPGTSPADTFG